MMYRTWSVVIGFVTLAVVFLIWNIEVGTEEYCDVGGPDDYVRMGEVIYERVGDGERLRTSDVDFRRVYATVQRQDSGWRGCEFDPRDGDAANLLAATSLYAVRGASPTLRLAAPLENGRFALYEAAAGVTVRRGVPGRSLAFASSCAAARLERHR